VNLLVDSLRAGASSPATQIPPARALAPLLLNHAENGGKFLAPPPDAPSDPSPALAAVVNMVKAAPRDAEVQDQVRRRGGLRVRVGWPEHTIPMVI
jgi:hypothetical protein